MTKYRVIVSGVVRPECSRGEVLQRLAALFHSRRETMEKLLQGKATPLTREYDLGEAEKIREAIVEAGAECYVEEIVAEDDAEFLGDDGDVNEHVYINDNEADDSDEHIDDNRREDDGYRNHEHDDDGNRNRNRDRDRDREHDGDHDRNRNRDRDRQSAPPPSAILTFVATNTKYYARQFAKFGEPPAFKLTWHWPAFFVFFFWAVYRKLWRWAGIHLAGGIVLALLFDPGFVYLAWAILWPLVANYLYFRHARNCVLAGGDFAARGGVSRGALGVGVLLMMVLSWALNSHLADNMLERYAERAGEVLPGPGTRQRGDGSAIDDLTALDSKTAKTVAELGVLAVSLKLAASQRGLDDNQLALSVFQRALARKIIRDPWGNQIALRETAAGQIALISAGEDGEFDNADDILQYINFGPDSGSDLVQ